MRVTVAALAALGLWLGAGTTAFAQGTAPSNTVWLCNPTQAGSDPCLADESTTVVPSDPADSYVIHFKPAAHPGIDCFYVYPTVNDQATVNAPLTIDPEETAIAKDQASPFSHVCRVFAPVYPQITLGGSLLAGLLGLTSQADDVAYSGVLSAWEDYMAHDNDGRGVVLIGHSQGAIMLIRLIHDEIDSSPRARAHLVSAILLGGNVGVPPGELEGGDFQHVPACTYGAETGCVVAYSSFDRTPPADSAFGQIYPVLQALTDLPTVPDEQVLCVNPAQIDGQDGHLYPLFPSAPFPGALGALIQPVDVATPWADPVGQYTARCAHSGNLTWLQIDDVGPPDDPIPAVTEPLPELGLHLADVAIDAGNLVHLVWLESRAYLRRHFG